jgi:hypothetical protein
MYRLVPKISVFLLALLAFGTTPLAAQVNVEALRRDPDRQGFSGVLAFDLALRAGNVDLVQLAINGRADHITRRSASFLVGSGDLGLEGGSRFTNAGLLHLRHAHIARHWLAVEAFGQINYEEPRLLDFRALVGSGVRVRAFDREQFRLSVGTGYMFEHERLDLPSSATHPVRTSVHRWNSYASLWGAPAANVVFGLVVYVQPQIDDVEDVRMLSDVAVSIRVTEAIAMESRVNSRFDSRPPDGIERGDLALKTGISVAF